MPNLSQHMNGFLVRRADVDTAFVPSKTATWNPIPHSMLIDQVQDLLIESGYEIARDVHGMWHDGMRYFGLMAVTDDVEKAAKRDYQLVIGLRNSNDKTLRASLMVGACDTMSNTLSFSGEVFIGRKHTKNIERDLPGLIATALGSLTELRVTQDQRIAAYRKYEMPNIQAHDLMIKAMDAGVINGGRLPHVLKLWREPEFEELEDKWTAWRLFIAFTTVMRDKNIFTLPDRTTKLHGLLDSVSGMLTNPDVATSDDDIEDEVDANAA